MRSFPGPGSTWQISVGGGDRPVWSKNGNQIFYRSRDGIMVTYATKSATFISGKSRLWAAKNDLGAYFDLAPDGQRFAALQPVNADKNGDERLTLLQNFFDELGRRVPPGDKQ